MIRTATIFLLAGAVFAQQPTAQIDAIFAPLAGAKTPGLAVLVRKDGRTVFQRGYGVWDMRAMTKIDGVTDFRLASFTKQFTAMAVMLLVHDRKIRYDETLTEIFLDFPAYGKSVTVRNLLNHTSGLPDYEDLMDAAEKAKGPIWSPEKQIQDDQVLELLKKEPILKEEYVKAGGRLLSPPAGENKEPTKEPDK